MASKRTLKELKDLPKDPPTSYSAGFCDNTDDEKTWMYKFLHQKVNLTFKRSSSSDKLMNGVTMVKRLKDRRGLVGGELRGLGFKQALGDFLPSA